MHIHILGICGTFMGGIAAVAVQAGHRVTGCDANVYPPMSDQLADLGVDLIEGFGVEQLALKPDCWVVGNVVSRSNPLMEAILDARLPYISGPQWLAENVLVGRPVIAVAGTHGKTTTTAMARHIFQSVQRDVGYLVGGVPADGSRSAAIGDDPAFVIEADEYDTAFFDKRSKFVHYRPSIAILNNLEFDHADIFDDLSQIQTQFHHLVRTVPANGYILRPAQSEALDQVLARGCWTPVQTFGQADAHWSVQDLSVTERGSDFTVAQAGIAVGRCELGLAGSHNRLNALAAIAACVAAGVEPVQAVAAMNGFAGVRRRLELRGTVGAIRVIDDFAHHPTAIALTIDALVEQMKGVSAPAGRVLAVLEPRSNTMRSGTMNQRLASSVDKAELVYCYTADIDWDADQVFDPLGERYFATDDLPVLVERLVADARAGDQILIMSNGGFGGIHAKVLEALRIRHH